MLKAIADALTRVLETVMVLCLAVMLVMVFGNVILRLFFNTGIDLSEEIPRFAFVWMTFLAPSSACAGGPTWAWTSSCRCCPRSAAASAGASARR